MKRESGMEIIDKELKSKARRVFKKLKKLYPDAHCELDFKTPFQLLVATILSAQCTDVAVNKVTPDLFRRYPTAAAMAAAKVEDLESLLRSIGLYHHKAKNLQGMAQRLVDVFGGEVPQTRELLVSLAGVGRKTANVVLSNGFNLPGLAVDTHVLRVGKRLGLFEGQDPVKVEHALGALIPSGSWGMVSHWLIWHGRRICKARGPLCGDCSLIKDCEEPIRWDLAGDYCKSIARKKKV